MKNKLIIIADHPASGKTELALKLSNNLHIPFFNLDSIKSAIGKSIEVDSWETSKCIGHSSFLF
jgi:tRNA A37 N6-isopentenylltransferase MiaA